MARSVQGTAQVQTGTDLKGNPIYTTRTTSTTVCDATSQDMWFAYDAMNRQVLVDGVYNKHDISANNINSAQGNVVAYDLNGNRTKDTCYGQQVTLQEQTDYVELGNSFVSSSYAHRQGAFFNHRRVLQLRPGQYP